MRHHFEPDGSPARVATDCGGARCAPVLGSGWPPYAIAVIFDLPILPRVPDVESGAVVAGSQSASERELAPHEASAVCVLQHAIGVQIPTGHHSTPNNGDVEHRGQKSS